MTRIYALIATAVILFSATHAGGQENRPFKEIIAMGDAAYRRFDNSAALLNYQKALEMEPRSYEAAWKLARAYVDVGENLHDKADRRGHYEKAHEAARKAVGINPQAAEGHLWLSIALGRVALDAGGKEKVKLSKEIRSEVEKALAIDPGEDLGWLVLGLWHRNVATLNWIERKFADLFFGGVPKDASLEKAVDCLRKAVELNDAHINNHLELGITYEMVGEKDKAILEYRRVLELPISDSDDKVHKKEAKRRLTGLRD